MEATEVKPYLKDGFWNYPGLPAGFREAVPSDFSILSDELVFGINCLFKRDIHSDYEARCIRTVSELDKWKPDIIAGKVFIDKLPYKDRGLWVYPSLPLGCRKASFAHFLTAGNEIIPEIDFLVIGSGTTEYEAHRTGTIERFIPWLDWVQVGRVYIKKAS